METRVIQSLGSLQKLRRQPCPNETFQVRLKPEPRQRWRKSEKDGEIGLGTMWDCESRCSELTRQSRPSKSVWQGMINWNSNFRNCGETHWVWENPPTGRRRFRRGGRGEGRNGRKKASNELKYTHYSNETSVQFFSLDDTFCAFFRLFAFFAVGFYLRDLIQAGKWRFALRSRI